MDLVLFKKGCPEGEKERKAGEASMKPETTFFDKNGPRFVQKGLPRG